MSNNSFHEWSILSYFKFCFILPSTYGHFIAFVLVNVPFILPLCLYILHQGVQQWRSRAKISHTDFFTYNMVVVQLIGIVGSCLLIIDHFLVCEMVTIIGIYMLLVTYSTIVDFQMCTCAEHYMAVVHPVTYLSLKSQTWTRNVSCAFVWLHCIIQSIYLSQMKIFDGYFALNLAGYSLSFLIAFFCNVSVLHVLMRPQPGDGAKGKTSKQKALYTITAITATLLVKFAGDVFCTGTFIILAKSTNSYESYDESCTFYFSFIWFTLPSTLVLPLLFLHRNQKLLFCKRNK